MALRQEELTSLCDDVDLERDRALVERCQAGDSAAFGNLYARYYERLLRFCLRRLNDRHEAEDAAQEAFARAWKALPRFAGERRFYPWLTVIAGNICTDMLRRRSRSTPTDDMELTAQHQVGVAGEDTSEELVLAAVDGELVNRALNRLSTRHRHVLAMREGSGWTYQQIADHEGVEIGTIETLLWRARQALKREFAVVSESKEALAGFLVATGALFRRTLFRMAHRSAGVQHQSGGTGGLRNAMAGMAVTGAAVAVALVAPARAVQRSEPSRARAGRRSRGAAARAWAARPRRREAPERRQAVVLHRRWVRAAPEPDRPRQAGARSSTGQSSTGGGAGPLAAGTPSGGTSGSGITGGLNQAAGGFGSTVTNVAGGLGSTVTNVAGGLGGTVTNVAGGLGSTVSGTTGTLNNTLNGATSGVNNLTQALGLGSVLPSGTSPTTGSRRAARAPPPPRRPPRPAFSAACWAGVRHLHHLDHGAEHPRVHRLAVGRSRLACSAPDGVTPWPARRRPSDQPVRRADAGERRRFGRGVSPKPAGARPAAQMVQSPAAAPHTVSTRRRLTT